MESEEKPQEKASADHGHVDASPSSSSPPRIVEEEGEGLLSPSTHETVYQVTGDNDYTLAPTGWYGASLSSLSDAPLPWPPQEGQEEVYHYDRMDGTEGGGGLWQAQPGEQPPQETNYDGQMPWDYDPSQYTAAEQQYSGYSYQQPAPHQPQPPWEGDVEAYNGGSDYAWGEGLPPQEGMLAAVEGGGGPSPNEAPLHGDCLSGTSLGEKEKEVEGVLPAISSGDLQAPHTSHRTQRLERLIRFMKKRPYFPRRLVPFQKPRAQPKLTRHPIHESRRIVRLRRMVSLLKRRKALARKRAETQAKLNQGQKREGQQGGLSTSPADAGAGHPPPHAPAHLSKPWPVVVQYINEVLSQCLSPGVQSTMHWTRLQAYRDLAVLYRDLNQLDPYRRRMTGPLTITVNLSRKRSVTGNWQLQQPADDGTVEGSLSGVLTLATATSHDGKGSSATSHSTASRERRQSQHKRDSKTASLGLSALQGLIPVKRKPSLNSKDSQQPSSSPSSSNSNSTGRRVSSVASSKSRRRSSAHGAHSPERKSSVLQAMQAPLSVSERRQSSGKSSSGSSETSSRRQSTESSTSTTAAFPREVIRDHPAGANLSASRDVIPFDEGQLAKEPLAFLHKILRDPNLDRVPKRIRDFGDRDYAILSSMIKADVMVRTRAVSAKAKSLAFLTMAHEPSLVAATIRLGSYLTSSEVACLACCSKQAFQVGKTFMRNQRAAVLAQSGARLHLERQRYERLKNMWRSALNIQKVFRGYILGRKKLQRSRVRLLRLQTLGLEGDVIDVLEDKLLQPATRLEACRVIALMTKSRSVNECRAFIELGFFKVVSDQLRASDNTNEIIMMAITCLTNLLGGFTSPAPDPFRCYVIQALECLLCSTTFDEVETACRYISSLSPMVARGFPLTRGLLDCLVDLLMNPMEEGLFFQDFPFSLTARIKSWALAAQAFVSAIAADPSLVSSEVARDGAKAAVVSSLLSVLHVVKVCHGRLLRHKYSSALVRHVRYACMEAIPVLTALHKELFCTYTFTDSYPDAQLALVADQLLHPSLSCSRPAHQHGLYILDIMCHDLKASMFLLVSGIVPTLESLLEIYLEGETRDSLEKLVCLLTKPILTPAEVMVPFDAATPGTEQKELDAVVEQIQSFDANKERFADQACHVLLKALEEKQ